MNDAPRELSRTFFWWTLLTAAGVAAVGEIVVFFVGLQFLLRRYALLNPDALWMVPLLDVPLFGLLGWGAWRLARAARSRLAVPCAIGTLAFLAVFEPLLVLNSRIGLPAVALLSAGIATALARLLCRDPERSTRLLRPVALSLLGLCVAGSLAWHAIPWWQERRALAALPAAPAGAPNIILVVLDAVRAPALHLYGNPRPNTPFLDSLAGRSARFDHAYAPAPWTLPSHSSMFTGRWPTELAADWSVPLERGPTTLAEHLAGRGYETGGFSANLRYVSRLFGLSRGFHHFGDYPIALSEALRANSLVIRMIVAFNHAFHTQFDPGRKRAARISDEALAWTAGKQRPFLLFLNYFDAHQPYDPPPPYDTLFSGARRGFEGFDDLDAWARTPAERSRALEVLRAGYEAAVAYEDAQLRRLFTTLAARGQLDDAIVVITADHGDLFGEHGLVNHGDNLYPLMLRVPLVIYAPRRVKGGTVIETPVSLRDLPATISALAGDSSHPFPGGSLFGLAPSPAFSSVRRFPGTTTGPLRLGDMRSLSAWPWHYILNGNGVEELYDLRGDTLATNNLAGQPGFADSLRVMRERTAALP